MPASSPRGKSRPPSSTARKSGSAAWSCWSTRCARSRRPSWTPRRRRCWSRTAACWPTTKRCCASWRTCTRASPGAGGGGRPLIRKVKKKSGGSVEEVLAHAEASRRELEGIEGSSELARQLEMEIAALEKELKTLAGEISRARRQAAAGLQVRVEEELKQLGMPKVRFQGDLQDRTNEAGKLLYTATGKDRVEFLISPNLGEPFRRLAQIISGGEMSRVMLALKNVLASSDQIGTLIFDEVDSGIGGEGALAGRKSPACWPATARGTLR